MNHFFTVEYRNGSIPFEEYNSLMQGTFRHEIIEISDDLKKVLLGMFLDEPYHYRTFKNVIDSKGIYSLYCQGYISGHAVHFTKNEELRGYFGLSKLGETWLEFNEL